MALGGCIVKPALLFPPGSRLASFHLRHPRYSCAGFEAAARVRWPPCNAIHGPRVIIEKLYLSGRPCRIPVSTSTTLPSVLILDPGTLDTGVKINIARDENKILDVGLTGRSFNLSPPPPTPLILPPGVGGAHPLLASVRKAPDSFDIHERPRSGANGSDFYALSRCHRPINVPRASFSLF